MSELLAPAPDQIKDMTPDELLKQYDRLIKKVSNRYSQTVAHYAWIDDQDIQQVASIALLKAQERFDLESNVPFISFAWTVMQRDILKALNIRCTPYGTTFEPQTVSLDEKISDDSDITRGEVIPGTDEPLDDQAVKKDIAERVRAAVYKLPKDQEEVIERLYLNDPTETKQQIAKTKGVSNQCIKNRQAQALRKLRHKLWYLRPEIPNHIGFSSFNTRWMSEPEQYVINVDSRRGRTYDDLLELYNEYYETIYGKDESE